jgi:hypothetical protein
LTDLIPVLCEIIEFIFAKRGKMLYFSLTKITSQSKFEAKNYLIFIYRLVSGEEALGIQRKAFIISQEKNYETK